jgi:phospholipid/cholesterol/gamma-HCH transport system substrate-binding protein
MENRAHALAAGIFVLVMGLALIAGLSWFQGDRTERLRYTIVSATAVTGLNVKAPVKLRGVDVGKVETIGFDPADSSKILVGILVDQAAPLTHGTYAQLNFQGVTGLQFVSLSDAGGDTRPLRAVPGEAPPQILLRPTLLDDLATAAPQLVIGAKESVRRINAVLSDSNRAQVDQALAKLTASMDELARIMAALRPAAQALPGLVHHADSVAVRADALLGKVDGTLAKVDGTVTSADDAIAQVGSFAQEASGLAQDLRGRTAVVDQLGATAAQLERTTRHLDQALTGAGHGPALLDQAGSLAGSLQQTVEDIDQQPQSLLFGRATVPPGPGESGFAARLKGTP